MSLWRTLVRYFDIAYRPGRAGIVYEEAPGEGGTKAVVETLSAALILYASYADLSDKFLKAFAVELSESTTLVGRIIVCLLAVFVCLHVIFSIKAGSPPTFTYSRIPRLLAGILIWFVLFSLAVTVLQFFKQEPTSLGANDSYYEVPAANWRKEGTPAGDAAPTAVYVCRLVIPGERSNTYKDVRVFITPNRGFTLTNVTPRPKEGRVIRQSQEPLEVGRFEDIRSEWLFADFEPANEWELWVAVAKKSDAVKFADAPPLKVTVYLYK